MVNELKAVNVVTEGEKCKLRGFIFFIPIFSSGLRRGGGRSRPRGGSSELSRQKFNPRTAPFRKFDLSLSSRSGVRAAFASTGASREARRQL